MFSWSGRGSTLAQFSRHEGAGRPGQSLMNPPTDDADQRDGDRAGQEHPG